MKLNSETVETISGYAVGLFILILIGCLFNFLFYTDKPIKGYYLGGNQTQIYIAVDIDNCVDDTIYVPGQSLETVVKTIEQLNLSLHLNKSEIEK